MGYASIIEAPNQQARPLSPGSSGIIPRAAPVASALGELPRPQQFGSFRVEADTAMKVIGTAAQAPAYIYDRPLALLNQAKVGDKGLIDQAGDTIRNIPVLGDLLSGGAQAIGNTINWFPDTFASVNNSFMAGSLRKYDGMDPEAGIDPIDAFLSGVGIGHGFTVKDLRNIGAQRGFTDQDVADIKAGRRGIYDFKDRGIDDNALVDITGRLVIDPLNLVTFGGAAAARGAARILPGAITSMTRLDRLATGMTAMNKAVGLSRGQAKSTIAGMAALRAGSVEGVTLNTLGRHLAMFSRGSSDFLRAYRKVAVTTTAGQLAAQAVGDSGVLDNTPLGPLFEPIYEAAKRMSEDKPLSDGMVFNLWAAVNFPVRDSLSAAWTDTRRYGLGIGVGKATVRTPLLRRVNDIERRIIESHAPGMSLAEGRRYLEGPDGFGSAERFNDYMLHWARSMYVERYLPDQNAVMNQPVTTAEFAATATINNRAAALGTRMAIEDGVIAGRDLMTYIRQKSVGPRSTTRDRQTGQTEIVSGQVDTAWDPKSAIRRWNDWAMQMEQLALKAGFQQGMGMVIGVADGALPKEWLRKAKQTIKAMKREDGSIPKQRMDEFLEMFPALDVDANDPSNFFARLRHPDSGEVHVDAAIQRLDKLEKDAITLREYLWDVEQWEARAQRIAAKRGRVLGPDGTPDPTRAPDIGGAAVFAATERGRIRRAIGVDDTYDDLLERRGNENTRLAEEILVPALDDSGFNVDAATQGVVSVGGRKRAGVAVHLSPREDPASALLTAALVAKHTRSGTATVLFSGADNLRQHGLTDNAVHSRFDIGRMSSDEADAVLSAVQQRLGDQFEFNDTAGVLHVIARDGQEEAIQLLVRDIAGIVGDERARVRHDVAWVQVVRNDTRGAIRGGRAAARPDDASARDIFARNESDIRYITAQSAFRTAADERGGVPRGGAPAGFERTVASRHDDLGRDGRGLTDRIREADTTGTQGQVLWLAEADDALAAQTPKLNDDLAGLPAEELAKVLPVEAELRRYNSQYRIKAVRDGSPTYYVGQGDSIRDVVAASRATSDLMYHKVWKPSADFFHALFGRVYTRTLAHDAKQFLYGRIFDLTKDVPEDARPTIKEIDSFLQTLDGAARNSALFGSQLYARGDMLPPKTIADIADGTYIGNIMGVPLVPSRRGPAASFRGFSPEALAAMGGAKNIARIMDQTGSRFYRDLRQRTKGKGQLGALIKNTYGWSRATTATPRNYIRTWYHLFRFTLDPRWHIQNRMEADVLGHIKYGVSRFNGARSPEAIDNAVRLHSGGNVKGQSDLLRDALASGTLDARHLEGYIGRAFKKGREQSARDVLRTMAAEDPSMVALRRRFGGTEDEWVDGLEQMMYEFDNRGTQETIRTAAESILDEADRAAMEPLLLKLYARNDRIFKDAVSTFHGNTNRSNLERILNSYFLFWPISYQLKATKWLFDVLTKQTLGRKTNLLGAWTIDRLYQQHIERLATDETYQRMFVDNPELWRTAAMLLPVTPFDMGIGLSRITKYGLQGLNDSTMDSGRGVIDSASDFLQRAAGPGVSQMFSGLGTLKDERFKENPIDTAIGLAAIGPVYTIELAKSLYRQSRDKERDLVVPTN